MLLAQHAFWDRTYFISSVWIFGRPAYRNSRTSRPGQRKLEPLEQTGGSEGRSSPMHLSKSSKSNSHLHIFSNFQWYPTSLKGNSREYWVRLKKHKQLFYSSINFKSIPNFNITLLKRYHALNSKTIRLCILVTEILKQLVIKIHLMSWICITQFISEYPSL